MILHHFSFVDAITTLITLFLDLLTTGWILKTLIFVILAGSVMALIERSGGVNGFVHYVLHKKAFVKSERSALMLSYVIGVVVFVETSITALVSGAVGRPLCDKYKIPHAKLALVCDSTSAPIGSLILFNGYGALLLGLIATQISLGNLHGTPIEILIHSIGFNLYAVLALIVTFIFIYFKWEIGPMRYVSFQPLRKEQQVQKSASMGYMLLPIVLMLILVFVFLYISGNGEILKGSGSSAIFYTIATTLLFTLIYYVSTKNMSLKEWFSGAYEGGKTFVPISFLLVFAFALGDITSKLETGAYLASLVSDTIPVVLLASLIFFLSAIISFATGTSWGTFSIMMPIAIPMAVAMDANIFIVIGAVMSGGIFGDHCSPISDTTIISSMASQCDVVEHVKTQLPYALVSASIAFVLFALFSLLS